MPLANSYRDGREGAAHRLSDQSEDLPEHVASARGRDRPMRMDEVGMIPSFQ